MQGTGCMARNSKHKRKIGAWIALGLLAGCSGNLSKFTMFDLIAPRKSAFATPENLPPADYQGEFWVDTKGCIFIRTGNDEWLPQVDTARKPICDPSRPGQAVGDQPSTAVDPTPRVIVDPETGFRTEILAPVSIAKTYVHVAQFDPDKIELARGYFAALGYPVFNRDKTPPSDRASSLVLGPFTVKGALDDALEVTTKLGYADAYAFKGR